MLQTLLLTATEQLEKTGIATARLDVLVLLEDLLHKDRSWIIAHPEYEIDAKTAAMLQSQIRRRSQHTPLAYIRGKSEFYGREFTVNAHTLEPRPESETIIDLLKRVMSYESGVKSQESKADRPVIVDVGTGSGCLAITAKLEFPNAEVYATDIDAGALKIAKQNAEKLSADVQFFKGDLLDPLSDIKYQISNIFILANLPYVPNDHTINEAAMQEPKHAIFGGPDGLDLYRKLFAQLKTKKFGTPVILTESLPFQHATLLEIAETAGYTQKTEEDFIQVFGR